ncbi:MAG: SurA N-terminal domain-containing protein [Deltaproteobacteria bacterium]|nr:SurA N-terminal domain-containing protein [Deltaproteobacteria bacterium]
MKNKNALGLFVVFMLGSFPLHAKIVDRVVAVVNNDAITELALERAMAMKQSEIKRSTNPELTQKTIRSQVLSDMINQKLLQQEIIKANIEVSDDDLARAIANVLQKNGINIEILRAELAGKGIPFESYKEQLKDQIRQTKFMQQHITAHVSDEEVQSFKSGQVIPDNPDATVHLAVIFFPLDPDASTKDVKDVVRKGRKISDKARQKGDFAKLARDNSKGPEAKEGGDLGTKSLSELPAPVAAAVRKMGTGMISDPIIAPQGIYIIKVIDKSASANLQPEESKSDEGLRQNLYNERMDQEINNYMMKLRRKAYVEILE